jgi:hypothetical protein
VRVQVDILKPERALATASAEGLAYTFDGPQMNRTVVVLKAPMPQEFIISMLRRAYAANPASALRPPSSAKDLPTVPCRLELGSTAEGTWLVNAQVGDLTIPLELEQEAFLRFADQIARMRQRIRDIQAPDQPA